MDARIIFQSPNGEFRILEQPDTDADIENLKGDVFNPKYMAEMHEAGMTASLLKQQEQDFEDLVAREGVFGYVLERWNPAIGVGWEHVDSCWGFIGSYSDSDATFTHYIVAELMEQVLAGAR